MRDSLLVYDGDYPQTVHRVRIDLFVVRMLLQNLFKQPGVFLQEFSVQSVKVLVIFEVLLHAAVAAGPVYRLAEYDLMLLDEIPDLTLRRCLEIDEIALYVIFEEIVELFLVVKEIAVGVVVEVADQLLVAEPCQERIALFVREIPESERNVIEIARAELYGALRHVRGDGSLAHA